MRYVRIIDLGPFTNVHYNISTFSNSQVISNVIYACIRALGVDSSYE